MPASSKTNTSHGLPSKCRTARATAPPISDDVASEVNRWLEVLLPELHRERSKARRAVAKRKRVLTKAAFRLLSAVHADMVATRPRKNATPRRGH